MKCWTILYQRDNHERTSVERITAPGAIDAMDAFNVKHKDEVSFVALLEGHPVIWTTPPRGYVGNNTHPLDSMPSGF